MATASTSASPLQFDISDLLPLGTDKFTGFPEMELDPFDVVSQTWENMTYFRLTISGKLGFRLSDTKH